MWMLIKETEIKDSSWDRWFNFKCDALEQRAALVLSVRSVCFPADYRTPSSNTLPSTPHPHPSKVFIKVSVMKMPLTAKQWLLTKRRTWPSPSTLLPPPVWADRFPRACRPKPTANIVAFANVLAYDLLAHVQTATRLTAEEKWLLSLVSVWKQ